MKRCAFLTMDSLDGFFTYDDLVHTPLRERGWEIENVSWRAGVAWAAYDLVVVRSTWDYQDDPGAFMATLAAIEASGARLENPLATMQWNLDKRYLRELEAAGVAIVPTVWSDAEAPATLGELRSALGGGEIVVKPVVSANADHTYRLPPDAPTEALAALQGRNFMAQPFVDSIVTHGEYSVFHFAGEYSHAIVKTPKAGDFRVQEEHGGSLARIEPDERLRNAAQRAVDAAPGELLYARSDFVEHGGELQLMELELIEPSLYFNLDPASPERFAAAIDGWVAR